MEPKKYHFMEIKKGISIPIPRELTPEEEAAILAQAKEEFADLCSEKEWEELLRQRELGQLVSGEELLEKLEQSDLKNHF
jgi:hypothetical protein